MFRHLLPVLIVPLFLCLSCTAQQIPSEDDSAPSFINEKGETIQRMILPDEEWAKKLTREAFEVLRRQGTERAFTGEYWDNHEAGIYTCAACGLPLFDSDTKFESGTGWPSFFEPIDKTHVAEHRDVSFGMIRTEVHCNRCGGHLGHVFEDGPAPTGLRYCMNSVSLDFKPEDD
jgi:peptide-methionine (R)-S-oxide reductase